MTLGEIAHNAYGRASHANLVWSELRPSQKRRWQNAADVLLEKQVADPGETFYEAYVEDCGMPYWASVHWKDVGPTARSFWTSVGEAVRIAAQAIAA